MFHLRNIVRSKGDPKIVSTGPSLVRPGPARRVRSAGSASGSASAELFAPRRVTETLGMEGHETLVRAYGLREIVRRHHVALGRQERRPVGRVAGDGLDVAALHVGTAPDNPKKGNVVLALLMIGGIAMLDYRAAQDTRPKRPSPKARRRLYPNRSGFPKGLAAVKDRAKQLANSQAKIGVPS